MKGTKIVLVISGLLALGVGLAMNLNPAAFLGPEGIAADEKIGVLAWAQGSLLLAIGVTNFLALRVTDLRGIQTVIGLNIASHLFGLIVNVRALSAHLVSQSVMGDLIGHVVFAAAFVVCLVFLARRKVAPAPAV